MKKIIIYRILIVVFIVSIGLLINSFVKSYRANKLYAEARNIYYKNIEEVLEQEITEENEENIEIPEEETPEEPEEVEEQPEEEIAEEPGQEENPEPQDPVDISEFNENVIGWINVNGTNIDYPVVQADDNDFYLDHNYKGEKDSYGSIYMDFRNVSVERDDNIIIYGHKIRDGSMFSDLANYTNGNSYKDYFEKNNTITLDLNGGRTTWEIYSTYVVNLDQEDYYLYTIYKDKQNYLDFVEETKERSLVKKDIEITKDDTIISLVTCNFWYDNARVILHGKLIE